MRIFLSCLFIMGCGGEIAEHSRAQYRVEEERNISAGVGSVAHDIDIR